MASSTVVKRGTFLLTCCSLTFFCCVSYLAYLIPLPVLPVNPGKELAPFFQTRSGVRKHLLAEKDGTVFSTTLTSPFSLLHYDADGITETLHEVKGISREGVHETRFFSTKEAVFAYGERRLSAQQMSFAFEKGVQSVPVHPYYEGEGTHIEMFFKEATPHIVAEHLDGKGDIPFFFGGRTDAP